MTIDDADYELPFAGYWPILAGALAGIALRLAFSGDFFVAMTGGFMYFAPACVAAVTVYTAERYARRTWLYYFAAGFTANCFFVLGTMVIMIEGLICAVVIVPLLSTSINNAANGMRASADILA